MKRYAVSKDKNIHKLMQYADQLRVKPKVLPEREAVLNSAFEKRSSELRSEHARAGKERLRHLESQILPAIAIYETFRPSCRKMKRLILFTPMWKSGHIG